MITEELRVLFETLNEPELISLLRDAHNCGDAETAKAVRDEMNRREREKLRKAGA